MIYSENEIRTYDVSNVTNGGLQLSDGIDDNDESLVLTRCIGISI